jgi:hypothetical protein
MKSSFAIVLGLTISATLATTAAADQHKNSGQKKFSSMFRSQFAPQMRQSSGQGDLIRSLISKKHHQSNQQSGGGRPVTTTAEDLMPTTKPFGDGRVPVVPTRPGFVWVNGHWERARANSIVHSAAATPPRNPGGVSVTPSPVRVPGGVTVAPQGISPPHPVRPPQVVLQPTVIAPPAVSRPFGHRPSQGGYQPYPAQRPNGGVTVTETPNSVRNQGIPTLSGPGPVQMLENGASAVGSALVDLFSTEVGSPPPDRDHRNSYGRRGRRPR